MKSYDFKEALELQNEGIPSRLGLGTPRLFSRSSKDAESLAKALNSADDNTWRFEVCKIEDRGRDLGKSIVVLDQNADFIAFLDIIPEANASVVDRLTRTAAVACMVVGFLFSGGWAAEAASYEQRDGTIVAPIQSVLGGDLDYSWRNLEPSADLGGAWLDEAVLTRADLRSAHLWGATLWGADLTGADLRGADLTYAHLTEANLSNAHLTGADLRDAWLNEADLTGADLRGVDLTHSALTDADLSGANLTEATGIGSAYYVPYYDAQTNFTNAWDEAPGGTLFDPVAKGWIFVPEPSGMLLGITKLVVLVVMRGRNGGF